MKQIFFLIIFIVAMAQYTQSQIFLDTIYYNIEWKECNKPEANYYRILEGDTTDALLFIVNDYYFDGTLQMTGKYKSINPDIKIGEFIYYYPNGNKQLKCNYNAEGKLDGEYIEYFEDGSVKSRHTIINSLKEGSEKTYDENGNLIREINYKKGMKHGKFLLYYENGNLKRKDIYKMDIFIKGECFTRDGKDTAYYAYFIMPEFLGGIEAFKKFVKDKLNYPSEAKEKNEEGKVYIKFTINKQGELINPYIVQRDKEYFNNEALRVIQLSPQWIPGKREGKVIDVTVTIPIIFKLK